MWSGLGKLILIRKASMPHGGWADPERPLDLRMGAGAV